MCREAAVRPPPTSPNCTDIEHPLDPEPARCAGLRSYEARWTAAQITRHAARPVRATAASTTVSISDGWVMCSLSHDIR